MCISIACSKGKFPTANIFMLMAVHLGTAVPVGMSVTGCATYSDLLIFAIVNTCSWSIRVYCLHDRGAIDIVAQVPRGSKAIGSTGSRTLSNGADQGSVELAAKPGEEANQ